MAAQAGDLKSKNQQRNVDLNFGETERYPNKLIEGDRMLRIENLSKTYGGKCVLQNIRLNLVGKQTHVLIGSSGSGKSTLQRLILGLERATTGFVEIDGVSLTMASQQQWAQR